MGALQRKTLREIFEELTEYYDYILTLDIIFISSETQKILKSNKKTRDVTILEYHLLSEDTIDEQIFRCLQNKHNNSIIFEMLIKSAAKSKFKIESDLIERSLEIARKKAV